MCPFRCPFERLHWSAISPFFGFYCHLREFVVLSVSLAFCIRFLVMFIYKDTLLIVVTLLIGGTLFIVVTLPVGGTLFIVVTLFTDVMLLILVMLPIDGMLFIVEIILDSQISDCHIVDKSVEVGVRAINENCKELRGNNTS